MKRRHPDSADLAGGLWELVIPLGVGAAVGAAAIVILRAAGLRFTWALLGAPVAYLAWAIDWQAGLACATATALAGGAGLLWHSAARQLFDQVRKRMNSYLSAALPVGT